MFGTGAWSSLPRNSKASAMVSSRRPTSNQGTLLLDAFREDGAESNAPAAPCAHVTDAELDASLPAFAVLRTAGFVTALGCVCAAAVLREGHDVPGMHVDLRRLEIAGKALGKPLRRADVKAFAAVGLPTDQDSVVLDANLVSSQWKRLPRGLHHDREARENFWSRYKRLLSGGHPQQKWGVSAQLPLFGKPVTAAAVSEDTLARLMSHLDLPYATGRHYGLDWELLVGIKRHSDSDYLEEERDAVALSTALSFVLGRAVPSRPRRLNAQDHDGLHHLRDALARGVLPQEMLRAFPSDGRMLIVNELQPQP